MHQRVILRPRRIQLDDLRAWAEAHLAPTDAVVLEATTNAWYVYDRIAPLVNRRVVANPLQVKCIAGARVKTDKHDALRLARLLAANLVPEVWVPPVPVGELRAAVRHRRQVVKQQARTQNRLHSLLHRHYIVPPPGNPFAAKHRERWLSLELRPTERVGMCQDLATLDLEVQQLSDLEAKLHRLSTSSPWAEQVPYLVQLPGFGLLTAMTVLAAIGDVTRFPTAKYLVGYAELGAGVHCSGETHQSEGITNRGRRGLRQVLVEAAWSALTTLHV